MIYGCNNCYNPFPAELPDIGILVKFYIQDITGRMFLIQLCELCEKQMHEIEDRDSINEALNFIQDLIRKSTR